MSSAGAREKLSAREKDLNSSSKRGQAGGREPKAGKEMEKKGLNQRPKEAQTSMIKHSFRGFGGDGPYICGWREANKKMKDIGSGILT